LDRVSIILSKGHGDVVPLIEIDARIAYLREKYKLSSLQIDVEEPADHPADLGGYTFVRQFEYLKWVCLAFTTPNVISLRPAPSDRNGYDNQESIPLN